MNENTLHCSPYSQKKFAKDGTCYSTEDLKFIAKEYNKLNNNDKYVS